MIFLRVLALQLIFFILYYREMFAGQSEGQPNSREGRLERERQTSNRLYIFEYSAEKNNPKKQKEMDAGESRGEKSAAYLLKKEELKEKRRELEGEGMGMGADHRSNIDRLKSLIKNSRAFVKAPDSGVQKLVRALQKQQKTSNNIRTSFESIKKYTMVSSSNNYELFLQSRHPVAAVEVVKAGSSTRFKEEGGSRPKEETLLQINQHSEENVVNGDSFNYFKEISKQLTNKEDKHNISSFGEVDTPKQMKNVSQENIVTREDLNLSSSPVHKEQPEPSPVNLSPKLQLQHPKTGFPGVVISPPMKGPAFHEQSNHPSQGSCQKDQLVEQTFQVTVQNESDEIQLLFSQLAFIFTQKPREPVPVERRKVEKPSSPIFNLMSSIPSLNQSTTEYHPEKPSQLRSSNKSKQVNNIEINSTKGKSKVQRRDSKNDVLATHAEHANKMLFGEVVAAKGRESATPQNQKSIRNPLMQEAARRRVSSMPKITFTYTSRDKFEREVSPEMKDSIFPINIYRNRDGKGNSIWVKNNVKNNVKSNAKDEMQTTISSKQTFMKGRSSKMAGQSRESYYTSASPTSFQKVMVSPRSREKSITSGSRPIVMTRPSPVAPLTPVGPIGTVNPVGTVTHVAPAHNDYYGNYGQLKGFDQENNMQRRRERLVTTLPNQHRNVQYDSNEQETPGCCMGKETRSRSLNDRFFGKYQTAS